MKKKRGSILGSIAVLLIIDVVFQIVSYLINGSGSSLVTIVAIIAAFAYWYFPQIQGLLFNREETVATMKANQEAVKSLKDEVVKEKKITFISGKELVDPSHSSTGKIFQLNNDEVIFTLTDPTHFDLNNITFEGPQYQEVTETTGNGQTKKKRHGLAGTVIGTAIAPGVGTVAGAVAGHGMGKDKTSSKSQTTTKTVEVPANLTLVLHNKSNDDNITIGLSALQKDYQDFLNFKTTSPVTHHHELDDTTVAELKRLKELLETEVISQEEFDKKKAQLLDI
ncbi:SHOCT domain-containing protein [Levilactobacillus andaensis]|uniref:SHOCT domain-containing protein n=1 Tax=Levilactobacillus andaensis TaxID=2799570 RepID=UPI0019455979|nr:SHOCT domain-containing protein [Levilactobacillus andaensis]